MTQKLASEDTCHYIYVKGIRTTSEETSKLLEEVEYKPVTDSIFSECKTSANLEFKKLSQMAGYVSSDDSEDNGVKRPANIDTSEDLLPSKKIKTEMTKPELSGSDDNSSQEVKKLQKMVPPECSNTVCEDNVKSQQPTDISLDDGESCIMTADKDLGNKIDYSVAGGFFHESEDEENYCEKADQVPVCSIGLDKSPSSEKANTADTNISTVNYSTKCTADNNTEMNSKTTLPDASGTYDMRKAILEKLKAQKDELIQKVCMITESVGDVSGDINVRGNSDCQEIADEGEDCGNRTEIEKPDIYDIESERCASLPSSNLGLKIDKTTVSIPSKMNSEESDAIVVDEVGKESGEAKCKEYVS